MFVVYFLARLKAFGSTKINPLKIALSYSRLCLADGQTALDPHFIHPYLCNIYIITIYISSNLYTLLYIRSFRLVLSFARILTNPTNPTNPTAQPTQPHNLATLST